MEKDITYKRTVVTGEHGWHPSKTAAMSDEVIERIFEELQEEWRYEWLTHLLNKQKIKLHGMIRS